METVFGDEMNVNYSNENFDKKKICITFLILIFSIAILLLSIYFIKERKWIHGNWKFTKANFKNTFSPQSEGFLGSDVGF